VQLLAWDHGFHGNQADYYDPRNSFLNDVLERRTGIPITLATVYVEVGRRAGFAVRGVGFPAHFLARYEDVLFDPFNEGRILSEHDCRRLLAEASRGKMLLEPKFLEPAPTKQIVARMLNNLKHIYLRAHYYRKAIGVMDRLVAVDPSNYAELRDRGAVHAELRQYAQAQADLNAYLKHCGEHEDAAAVRQALRTIDSVMTLMDD
jgi:regulator of sirC expression with transglutaminase-like and TPR domain